MKRHICLTIFINYYQTTHFYNSYNYFILISF